MAVASPLAAAKHTHKKKAKAAVAVAPAAAFETDLLDWSQVPFSDQASHIVLVRQPQGLAAWTLRSSFAFGSQAALPHPAKDLFNVQLQWKVEGDPTPHFAAAKPELKSYPHWVVESAQEGDLKADLVTLYSNTDCVVIAGTVTNTGSKPLRVRPVIKLNRDVVNGYKADLEASPRHAALWLGLDRGAMVGRPLQEWAGVWMAADSWRVEADPGLIKGMQAQTEPLALSKGASVRQDGGLGASLAWALPQLLAPKQSLRFPFMLVWGTDKDAVQALGQKEWVESALPKGKAWKMAQDRWAATRARLPQGVDPRWASLAKRASLTLLVDDYAKRGALNARLPSADKGRRDAFYALENSVAALGWSELDTAHAEDALLELASFAAAAPAPTPPYTGEEKLAWEAAGLPLQGLAAWELYHRDPDLARAGRFLGSLGPRLRNECAWWPGARDGDGNGLYAFSSDEEKPLLYQRTDPALAVTAALSPAAGTGLSPTAAPTLQNYSVALTSLVAWQMQAASALAGAAGQAKESEDLLALSDKSRVALQTQAWDAGLGSYGPGDQAAWPFILGLDRDPQRAQVAMQSLIQAWRTAKADQLWAPWQRYYQVRGLASWGYLKESKEFSEQLLDTLNKKSKFCSLCSQNGQDEGDLDAASAAVALELSLERQEQEIFLTDQTGPFEARWLQMRTLDGSFYIKRTRLPEKKAIYAKISVETPKKGLILAEKSFIISCPEPMAVEIQSEWPLDVSLADKAGSFIFRSSHKIALLIPAKTRYLIHILPSEAAPAQ
jgi:hypothetical protein